jgi:flagellar basal-body rod protein FlgF
LAQSVPYTSSERQPLFGFLIAMYGIYLSASGAQAYDNYMNIVANNIANSDTPGFKKELAIIQAEDSRENKDGTDFRGSQSINDLGGGAYVYQSMTQFDHGKVKNTGLPTDVMISDVKGDAFFVINNAGKQMLTRAGNFTVNREGRLETQSGQPVLSAGGDEIYIDPRLPFLIDSNGNVTQKQTGVKTPLAIVRPKNLRQLKREGANLFSTADTTSPLDTKERSIRQGFLEMSSSSPTEEMMNLIQVQRAYEANIQMIQNQDSTYGSLISRVLQG